MEDKLSAPARVSMFTASYAPLWFILVGWHLSNAYVLGYGPGGVDKPTLVIAAFLVVVAVLACIMETACRVSRVRQSAHMEWVEPEQVRDVTHAQVPSAMSYVFFVAIGVASPDNPFVLVALAALACLVFSKTSMVLNNLSLLLVGFRMYEMRLTKSNRNIVLVTDRPPLDGKAVRIKMFAPGVFVDSVDPEGEGA